MPGPKTIDFPFVQATHPNPDKFKGYKGIGLIWAYKTEPDIFDFSLNLVWHPPLNCVSSGTISDAASRICRQPRAYPHFEKLDILGRHRCELLTNIRSPKDGRRASSYVCANITRQIAICTSFSHVDWLGLFFTVSRRITPHRVSGSCRSCECY